jgi:uncharacterized protein (TIGR02266 family)
MVEKERRAHKRVQAKFEISRIHEGDYLISFSKDISADGMFIHTDKPAKVGHTTKLIFSVGELDKVSVSAKVVWVNDYPTSKERGMGLQFIKPPKHLKEAILRIVNRVAVIDHKG